VDFVKAVGGRTRQKIITEYGEIVLAVGDVYRITQHADCGMGVGCENVTDIKVVRFGKTFLGKDYVVMKTTNVVERK
jgi:hypothetical protein